MPHLIQTQQIPMSKRRPYMAKYAAQLRKSLADPSLSQRERTRLQTRLDRLVAELRAYSEQGGE